MLTVVTQADTTLLTTLAACKSELQLAVTTDDAYLESLISQASGAIAGYCGRTGFGRETLSQTERLTRPRACIMLARDLAPDVASVAEDGAALDAASWELDGSLLYRLSGDARVPWSARTVVIAYDAGFALPDYAPADLARAAVLTVSAWYAARGRDPLLRSDSAEGIGATSWIATDATGGLPPQVEALLVPYQSVTV